MEQNQALELVKYFCGLLADGFGSQAGKELFTEIKDRFVGKKKAEEAIAQLEAAPNNALENLPEAVKTLEILLGAEIINDDRFADKLQQLMVTLENERSQEIGTDLTATESVEICENEQSIEGFSTGSQVLGKQIEAPSIKISGNTQTQKQTRDF